MKVHDFSHVIAGGSQPRKRGRALKGHGFSHAIAQWKSGGFSR
jgi:hypothetical protein